MRWGDTLRPLRCEWSRWFAWYPVKMVKNDGWVWLEYVMRQEVLDDYIYDYGGAYAHGERATWQYCPYYPKENISCSNGK